MKKWVVELAKVEYQAFVQALVVGSGVPPKRQLTHSSGLDAEQVLHLLVAVQAVVQAAALEVGSVVGVIWV